MITKNLWLKLGLLLSLSGLIIGYFLYNLQPVDPGGSLKVIKIKEGQGFREIGEILYKAGLIRSQKSFNIYTILIGQAENLRKGVFLLSSASSTGEIARELSRKDARLVTVTLTEGLTVKDMEKKLAYYGVIEEGDLGKISVSDLVGEFPFLNKSNSFEGYLFPDTYEFFISSDPKTVLRKFLTNFEEKALPILDRLSRESFRRKIILASILEKEVLLENDMRIVAGILEKRLKLGMALQVDATILYTKCDLDRDCESRGLTKADFEVKSPYNTYLNVGMPTGPISNPGLNSIVAALSPRNSPYFFYLSNPENKKTIFSVTLDEHNENRFKYLKIY